jgi:hypothetical protein
MANKRENYYFGGILQAITDFFQLKDGSFNVTFRTAGLTANRDVIFPDSDAYVIGLLDPNRATATDANGEVVASAVTDTELSRLSGVTSAIQTQLNGKQATLVSGTNIKTINSQSLLGSGDITISVGTWGSISGTLSAQTDLQSALNAKQNTLGAGSVTDTLLATNSVTNVKVATGIDAVKIGAGSVSNTEFSYLDGLTGAIQTQLNAKQAILGVAVSSNGTTVIDAIYLNRHVLLDASVTDLEFQVGSGIPSGAVIKVTNQSGAAIAISAGGCTLVLPSARSANGTVLNDGTLTITCIGTDIYTIEGDTD